MKVWTLITLVVTATIAPLQVSVRPVANANAPQTEDMRVLAAEDEYVAAEVSRDEAKLRLVRS
jgi:hypothetical protein